MHETNVPVIVRVDGFRNVGQDPQPLWHRLFPAVSPHHVDCVEVADAGKLESHLDDPGTAKLAVEFGIKLPVFHRQQFQHFL